MTDLKDQVLVVGKEVEDNDLTLIALNGLPPTWEPFIQGISARIELPKFERLRGDCIQEESRLAAKGAIRNSHGGDHHMLAAQSVKKKDGNWKKGNFKRNTDFRPSASHDSRKKPRDLSRIHCFRCAKFGHYVKQCQKCEGMSKSAQARRSESQ